MTLLYNLAPKERGIVQSGELPVWRFPDDYIERLRGTLTALNPE